MSEFWNAKSTSFLRWKASAVVCKTTREQIEAFVDAGDHVGVLPPLALAPNKSEGQSREDTKHACHRTGNGVRFALHCFFCEQPREFILATLRQLAHASVHARRIRQDLAESITALGRKRIHARRNGESMTAN